MINYFGTYKYFIETDLGDVLEVSQYITPGKQGYIHELSSYQAPSWDTDYMDLCIDQRYEDIYFVTPSSVSIRCDNIRKAWREY